MQLCTPQLAPVNLSLGLQDYSWGSWAARPASLRQLLQRDDKAPPPSFLLSLEAGNTDLPEPRTVLLQEKALGRHLVNIIPGGKLSQFPHLQTPSVFSPALPPCLSLGTKTFVQIHRNMLIGKQLKLSTALRGLQAFWALPGEEKK